MEINTAMSAADKLKTDNAVNMFNKSIAVNGRQPSQTLGKDDFLKILMAQMTNQDPTEPLDNTQFVAQMAQFSSLEQMLNMSNNFEKLNTLVSSSQAENLLGRTVELDLGDATTQGVVTGATRDANPQVQVNGMFYDMNKIKAVYNF